MIPISEYFAIFPSDNTEFLKDFISKETGLEYVTDFDCADMMFAYIYPEPHPDDETIIFGGYSLTTGLWWPHDTSGKNNLKIEISHEGFFILENNKGIISIENKYAKHINPYSIKDIIKMQKQLAKWLDIPPEVFAFYKYWIKKEPEKYGNDALL